MTTIVAFACNHPDNGAYIGYCDAITYCDELELRGIYWRDGCKFTYLDSDRVRVSRRIFRYRICRYGYGNWCWDGLIMERREARRLLRYLRDSGKWQADSGPTRLFKWFNRRKEACTTSI